MLIRPSSEVCAEQISFEVENNIVRKVSFSCGCPGNLEAISKLVEGMPVEEVIRKLKGIPCGNKSTSCPDQLARALEKMLNRSC